MTEGTGRDIAQLYRALEVENAAFRPRLETVLEALVDEYGLDVLRDVLSDLVAALPNPHHRIFGRHAAAGGYHVTANFDTCIERAEPQLNGDEDEHVVHIHGALGARGELSSLGARLRVIEDGFPEDLVRRLDEILCSNDVKVVVFVGYSGSDFFDATPYLLSRLDMLKTKTVVWHAFDPGALTWDVDPAHVASDLLTQLVAAGVAVNVVSGLLGPLLAQLMPTYAASVVVSDRNHSAHRGRRFSRGATRCVEPRRPLFSRGWDIAKESLIRTPTVRPLAPEIGTGWPTRTGAQGDTAKRSKPGNALLPRLIPSVGRDLRSAMGPSCGYGASSLPPSGTFGGPSPFGARRIRRRGRKPRQPFSKHTGGWCSTCDACRTSDGSSVGTASKRLNVVSVRYARCFPDMRAWPLEPGSPT